MHRVYPISLTVFFPTFNEEKSIVETVLRTIHALDESPYVGDYEVLVIDDGSTDATPELVEKLAHRYPRVRGITHPYNKGYGTALKTGLSHATKEYVFFTDADLQFDIVELHSLLVHLPHYDAVIGYRAPRRDPYMRLLNARGWNWLNRFLFGLRVQDIDCAFKIFRRDVVTRIPLRSTGAMINAEILIQLRQMDVPLKEVPVSHLPRTQGSPTGAKPSVILRALSEMIALYQGGLGSITHRQALKFMGVGVVNTALDLLIYVTLTRTTEVFADHLVVAKFLSFFAGTVSSLFLNRYWTFEMRSRPRIAEVLRFYTVVSISLVVNVVVMNMLLVLGVYDLIALIATTVLTFAISFSLSKAWVFRRPTARQSRHESLHHTPL